jgi:2'-5' RNA ligase
LLLSRKNFFVAVELPQPISDRAWEVHHHLANIDSQIKTLKSPPHITLLPPFPWETEDLPKLQASLRTFAASQPPFAIALDGFGGFKPKVVYIKVVENPNLEQLYRNLVSHVETELDFLPKPLQKQSSSESRKATARPHPSPSQSNVASEAKTQQPKTRPFRPHITLAKRLNKPRYRQLMKTLKEQSFQFEFTATHITLFAYEEHRWQVSEWFPLAGSL